MLVWPTGGARRRLTNTFPPEKTSLRVRFQVTGAGLLAAAVTGLLIAGPAGTAAALALGLTARHFWRAQRQQRNQLALAEELAAGLRLFTAQLRTGAHPAAAAEGAAEEAGAQTADLFRQMATAARLGGDVAATLTEYPAARGLQQPLRRLARAWQLAERHGAPLADLLESVRRDLARRCAFQRDTAAKLAGPRATAGVLVVLPVLGLVLGEGIGAAPLALLTGTWYGQLLLVVGTALLCAGMLWTIRLTTSVVAP